ncbi:MAG: hypothetical protein JWR26_4062 [Pedosphaera sp.]|nr:hypothetical protein [Pedosphaera sp.]
MSNINVELTYYPKGQLRNECSFENGILAWEAPIAEGQMIGVIRHWKREGKLLGEFHMDNGTGKRSWYENGQLQRVAMQIQGKLCGRICYWDEDGELLSESCYLRGKKGSKKKYSEANHADLENPQYPESKRTRA